jgi:hypothetical protein
MPDSQVERQPTGPLIGKRDGQRLSSFISALEMVPFTSAYVTLREPGMLNRSFLRPLAFCGFAGLLLAASGASPFGNAFAEGGFDVAQFDISPGFDVPMDRRGPTIRLRNVRVVFAEIRMLSDSDSSGDCECAFWFRVDGSPVQTWRNDNFATGERKRVRDASGNRVQVTLQTASDSVLIQVAGEDNDDDPDFGVAIDTRGLMGMPRGSGSDSERDWASASVRVPIPELSPGTLQRLETWRIPAFNGVVSSGEHGRFHFEVIGTINVF